MLYLFFSCLIFYLNYKHIFFSIIVVKFCYCFYKTLMDGTYKSADKAYNSVPFVFIMFVRAAQYK